MQPDATTIERLRLEYTDCFGCGLGNEHGLRLDGFAIADGWVHAPFAPAPTFAGFEGVLHGGIVATALDEISAWSAMLTEGVFVFTAKLDIRYRRQADADRTFDLRGHVTERRGKRLSIEAQLRAGDAVVAESTGLFVVAQPVADVIGG